MGPATKSMFFYFVAGIKIQNWCRTEEGRLYLLHLFFFQNITQIIIYIYSLSRPAQRLNFVMLGCGDVPVLGPEILQLVVRRPLWGVVLMACVGPGIRLVQGQCELKRLSEIVFRREGSTVWHELTYGWLIISYDVPFFYKTHYLSPSRCLGDEQNRRNGVCPLKQVAFLSLQRPVV